LRVAAERWRDRDVGKRCLITWSVRLRESISILETRSHGAASGRVTVFPTKSAYSVNALLFAVLEIFPSLSSRQKASAGLPREGCWNLLGRNPARWLACHQALRGVSRTSIRTKPRPDAPSQGPHTNHVAAFGFEELSWLARGSRNSRLRSSLVEEIYAAAFLYQERSEEPTPMDESIFTLVSKRARFEMPFPTCAIVTDFLRRAPEHATRAMIVALEVISRVSEMRMSG